MEDRIVVNLQASTLSHRRPTTQTRKLSRLQEKGHFVICVQLLQGNPSESALSGEGVKKGTLVRRHVHVAREREAKSGSMKGKRARRAPVDAVSLAGGIAKHSQGHTY